MATSQYTRDVLRVVVAQICQTIGWNSTQSTPLEVLTDVLSGYISSLGTGSRRYGEQFGHTQPTTADVDLAMRDLGVNVKELEEYVKNVGPVPCAVSVPRYPVKRESHLNLLKPGSREVLTRPVHIHEHLPAMHPELEGEEPPLSVDVTGSKSGSSPLSSPKNSLLKRPGEAGSVDNELLKRARMALEEEDRPPLREISSVMMTTSGFLSTAREGKLPEARPPSRTSDYPVVAPEVKGEKKSKKSTHKSTSKDTKKLTDKKKTKTKDKTTTENNEQIEKLVSMKEKNKLKVLKPGAIKIHMANKVKNKSKHKNAPGISAKIASLPKIPKLKKKNSENEKLDVDLSPSKSSKTKTKDASIFDGKLFSEPDLLKVNNFKKIFRVKEGTNSEPTEESHHRSMIGETGNFPIQKSKGQLKTPDDSELVDVESLDVKPFDIEPLDAEFIFDHKNLSPLNTPSEPRTPDLLSPQDRPHEQKKKGKRHRDSEDLFSSSPKRFKSESVDFDDHVSLLEKPKTPEILLSKDDTVPILPRNREDMMASDVFKFFPLTPGPGLIPPPLAADNPLFDRLKLSLPLQKQSPNLQKHSPNLQKPEPQVKMPSSFPTPPPSNTEPVMEVTETILISSPESKSVEEFQKKEKEHKKDKKDKIKKKKHKKDKLKDEEKECKKETTVDKKSKHKSNNKETKDKSEKKEKEREDKKKEPVPKLTLKLGPPSPQPSPPEPAPCKIVIKRIEVPREIKEVRIPSPEITQPSSSANTTPLSIPTISLKLPKTPTAGGSTPKSSKKQPKEQNPVETEKKEPVAFYFDEAGNQVWLCPACGGRDTGTPMIGCDSCDAWYHWVCVGIQVPPDCDNWFCRVCISKKQEKKKKKDKKHKKKTGSS